MNYRSSWKDRNHIFGNPCHLASETWGATHTRMVAALRCSGASPDMRGSDNARLRERRARHLRVALDVGAQLSHRPESDRALGELGFDRSIGVERVGHTVDDPRLKN